MNALNTVRKLADEISTDPRVAPRLLSVIWIGSRSRGLDEHAGSDLDIQIVMDRPDTEATVALSAILQRYSSIDLSILYPKDVWTASGSLDFQDGTKGAFFIPVLAAGTILHGIDFYEDLRGRLPDAEVRRTLRFTIREYLARLRVMALAKDDRSGEFKKYTMKLAKDLLVYAGHLSLEEMIGTPNSELLALAQETGLLGEPHDEDLIGAMHDYGRRFSGVERARLLLLLEGAFDSVDRRVTDRQSVRDGG